MNESTQPDIVAIFAYARRDFRLAIMLATSPTPPQEWDAFWERPWRLAHEEYRRTGQLRER